MDTHLQAPHLISLCLDTVNLMEVIGLSMEVYNWPWARVVPPCRFVRTGWTSSENLGLYPGVSRQDNLKRSS